MSKLDQDSKRFVELLNEKDAAWLSPETIKRVGKLGQSIKDAPKNIWSAVKWPFSSVHREYSAIQKTAPWVSPEELKETATQTVAKRKTWGGVGSIAGGLTGYQASNYFDPYEDPNIKFMRQLGTTVAGGLMGGLVGGAAHRTFKAMTYAERPTLGGLHQQRLAQIEHYKNVRETAPEHVVGQLGILDVPKHLLGYAAEVSKALHAKQPIPRYADVVRKLEPQKIQQVVGEAKAPIAETGRQERMHKAMGIGTPEYNKYMQQVERTRQSKTVSNIHQQAFDILDKARAKGSTAAISQAKTNIENLVSKYKGLEKSPAIENILNEAQTQHARFAKVEKIPKITTAKPTANIQPAGTPDWQKEYFAKTYGT